MTLFTLARKMMLTPAQAIAIAATVDAAANGQGVTRQEMIETCFRVPEACEYLASICRTVTA